MQSLAGPEAGVPAIDDPAFGEILQVLRERTGTDFASYRLPTVARRTVNRMISVGAATYADYLQFLRQREGEAARLLEHVTIKVSRFYRHAPTFDTLRREVLPELARHAEGRPITVWSIGCGCGEEPYTLAMLFAEAGLSCIIEATDIDPAALQRAALGYYTDAAFFELPKDLRERYIVRSDGFYEVSAELRERSSIQPARRSGVAAAARRGSVRSGLLPQPAYLSWVGDPGPGAARGAPSRATRRLSVPG
jgi:chemotaxis methyl-accepting protein methylase